MTYRVEKNRKRYAVIEKDTHLLVYHTRTERGAREMCRSLNLGAGFDGYTPAFFAQEFKQKERPSTE